MKPNKNKVGERIHEIRTKLGYSMEEFGRLLGDSPRSSVNNWEKGVSLPKKDKLEKIALLGNVSSDQILYGPLHEYLYELVEFNYDTALSDNILYNMIECIPVDKREYNDALWLFVAKYFLDNAIYGKYVGKYNYHSMLGIPNLYTANYHNDVIEQREDYEQEEVKYYVYADTQKNILHIMPFLPNEKNIKLLYDFPKLLEESESHEVFTSNFEEIGLAVADSRIVYYGLDKEKVEIKIISYKYDQGMDLYRVIPTEVTVLMFEEELKKQIKILKNKY